MRARAGLLAVVLLPILCALLFLAADGDGANAEPRPPAGSPGTGSMSAPGEVAASLPIADSVRTDVAAAEGTLGVVTLHGEVHAAEGGAIADASIAVAREGAVIATTHSDADGTFQLTVPPLPVHPLHLTATKPGRAPARDTLAPAAAPGDCEAPVLVLAAGAALQGFLLSAVYGAPTEGRVLGRYEDDHCVELLADAGGRFAGDSLAPGRIHLWATSPGSGWTDAGTFWLSPGRVCDCGAIRLAGGRTLTVTCLDDGAPVRGAPVWAFMPFATETGSTVTTDTGGRAVLVGQSLETVAVNVRAPGYRLFAAMFRPGTVDLVARLQRLPALRGCVRSAATGAALPGASCVLLLRGRLTPPQEPLPADTPRAYTGDDGWFRFTAVELEKPDLWVRARGHVPLRVPVDEDGNESLQIGLQPAAAVEGRVLRSAGGPASARIEVWSVGKAPPAPASPGEVFLASLGPPPSSPGGQVLATGMTDARGCFHIDDLPGVACVVVATERSTAASLELELQPGAVNRADLTLPPLASLRGHVGGMAAGNAVCVVLVGGAANTRTARVAADGTFAFPAVPPGSYLVRAFTEPVAPQLHELLRTLLTAGARLPEPDLTVRAGSTATCELTVMASDTGTVCGIATRNGLPAAGCRLCLLPADGGAGDRCFAVTAAADGSFTLAWVPSGRYRAMLHAGGSAEEPVLDSTEFTLAPRARVTLSLAGSAR